MFDFYVSSCDDSIFCTFATSLDSPEGQKAAAIDDGVMNADRRI